MNHKSSEMNFPQKLSIYTLFHLRPSLLNWQTFLTLLFLSIQYSMKENRRSHNELSAEVYQNESYSHLEKVVATEMITVPV